ncbi:LapA family protein [Parahaliea sp. F7430]|uniref:LapA family protein n=1 Tax=Sediminihaliea albiluteola TaxID=2758564 RepID=A0A7W2TVV6_9GAMM|nr:LapA family protein [Sediminihaliea albiluteola]MBA6412858.1 LapA family protein [Sediminihaliea albiluteola]
MRLLLKLITLLLLLAMLAAGVLFAVQNKEPVPLDLLVYTFTPRSLALWILSAFTIGGIAGMLASSAVILRLRAAGASSKRQLQKANHEIDRLRTAGLKDGE